MAGFWALKIDPSDVPDPELDPPLVDIGTKRAVLAGGCFWCTEAVFKELAGVLSIRAGYAGGTAETANYRAVCSGKTDHAEAIELLYDSARISFGQILKIFFTIAHDPTQMNRQGDDRGRQYRSAIFTVDDVQRKVASAYVAQLEGAGIYSAPIKTALEPLRGFYEAEALHQDYAARNPAQPYIAHTTKPKIDSLHRYFSDRV